MHPIDELREIANQFRYVQAEHEREGEPGSWRRRQGAKLARLEQKFATLLERWVPPYQQEFWRAYLYRDGAAPEVSLPNRLVFQGRSPSGSVLEVRERDTGERTVVVDGSLQTTLPVRHPVEAPFSFGRSSFAEFFEVPPQAVTVLMEYVNGESSRPPWQWARVLYDQGVIDAHFRLTERGRRLSRRA